jgi:hypothetical protein
MNCATGVAIPVVIAWEPVTTSYFGLPLEVVEYEVIVEGEDAIIFDVHLRAEAGTQVTVPAELLEPGTEYKFEVLAIEEGGNQTITDLLRDCRLAPTDTRRISATRATDPAASTPASSFAATPVSAKPALPSPPFCGSRLPSSISAGNGPADAAETAPSATTQAFRAYPAGVTHRAAHGGSHV